MINISLDIAISLLPNKSDVRVIKYIRSIPKIRPIGMIDKNELIDIISEKHISRHISLCGADRINEGFGMRVHIDPFTDYLIETNTNEALKLYEIKRKTSIN